MNKIIKVIFCLVMLLSAFPVFAANLKESFQIMPGGDNANRTPLGFTTREAGYDVSAANAGEYSVNSMITTAITAVTSLLGTIFVILIVYGGVLWMTAEGSEEQVKKSKKIMAEAAIGLFIVLAAYAISYFVTAMFLSRAVTPITTN